MQPVHSVVEDHNYQSTSSQLHSYTTQPNACHFPLYRLNLVCCTLLFGNVSRRFTPLKFGILNFRAASSSSRLLNGLFGSTRFPTEMFFLYLLSFILIWPRAKVGIPSSKMTLLSSLADNAILFYFFREQLVSMLSNYIHRPHLCLSRKQTRLVIFKIIAPLDDRLLNTLAAFLLFSLVHLVPVQLCPHSYKLSDDLPARFVFEHTYNLLVTSNFYTRGMYFGKITRIKKFAHIA